MDKKLTRSKSPAGSTQSKRGLRDRILEGQIKQAAASLKADSVTHEDFMSPSSRLLDLDPALSDGDLPRSLIDTDDDMSICSRESNNSRASILPISHKRKTGVAMDEATKLANETLLTAKKAIEEVGNMKRECKITALEGLQTLYGTCLALSDSRSRHKFNLEHERKKNAMEIVRIERAHMQKMRLLKEKLAVEINQTRQETQNILKETENIMKWLNFETKTHFKEMEEAGRALKNLEKQIKSDKTKENKDDEEKWGKLTAEMEKLSKNTDMVSNQLDTLRRHINELNHKYENLPLLHLGKDQPEEHNNAHQADTRIHKKNIPSAGQTQTMCSVRFGD